MRHVIPIAVLAATVFTLAAQTPPDPEERQRRADEYLKALKSQATKVPGHELAEPVVPPSPGPSHIEPATRAKYEQALQEYYAYFTFGMDHRKRVFAWQLWSSRIIFWVVLSLVAAGMYFAAVQFRHGLRRKPSAVSPEEVTEFAASLAGVKVRSPVLGVLILVISFAFFYLYIRFVYPIATTF